MVCWFRLVAACGLCAASVGCGDAPLVLDATLVKGTAPYALGVGEAISVSLVSEDGKSDAHADVGPDGSFKVAGRDGAGVPPGRYKVSYTHYNAPGAKAGPAPVTRKTATVWEVGPASKSFTLDLAAK